MSIEEKLAEAFRIHETNSSSANELRSSTTLRRFEELVSSGLAKRRGNQLLSISENKQVYSYR